MKHPSYKYQKPSFIVPKKKLIQKYPRTVSCAIIFSAVSIFFSRQIYDVFFRPADDFAAPIFIPPNRR